MDALRPKSKSDFRSLLSQMKHHEKQLVLKRRWLMGVAASGSEKEKIKELLESKLEPESLVRKDDLFYDNIRNFLEERFGESSSKRRKLDNALTNGQLLESHGKVKVLLSLLDAFTNEELCDVAKILIGGSVKFEKTRKKMKKLIKAYLLRIPKNKSYSHQQEELLAEIMRSLGAPAQHYHVAVTQVLNRLEELSHQTLSAMHRRLSGIPGRMPVLQPPKSGWNRGRLVKRVRDISLDMLSQLAVGDKLQEPLAKAMAVAGLSMRLESGQRMPLDAAFYHYSPEIEPLQNDIIKAIQLLQDKVNTQELKALLLLLDPSAELPIKSLRSAIRNMLTEYLFECGEVGPASTLTEVVTMINKKSGRPSHICLSDVKIEDEIEVLLSTSADMKQILWDSLPDCGLDEDYNDGYMEDQEVSESSDESDDASRFSDSDEPSESFADSNPTEGIVSSQPNGIAEMNIEDANTSPNGNANSHSFDSEADTERDTMHHPSSILSGSTSTNKYLALQEVCDRTSVVARCLVAQTLGLCAQGEGLDLEPIVVSYLRCPEGQAAEELMPSFPKSKLDKLKDLMDLK